MRRTIFITTLYIVLVRKKKLITINNDCSPGTSHSGGYSHLRDTIDVFLHKNINIKFNIYQIITMALQAHPTAAATATQL